MGFHTNDSFSPIIIKNSSFGQHSPLFPWRFFCCWLYDQISWHRSGIEGRHTWDIIQPSKVHHLKGLFMFNMTQQPSVLYIVETEAIPRSPIKANTVPSFIGCPHLSKRIPIKKKKKPNPQTKSNSGTYPSAFLHGPIALPKLAYPSLHIKAHLHTIQWPPTPTPPFANPSISPLYIPDLQVVTSSLENHALPLKTKKSSLS